MFPELCRPLLLVGECVNKGRRRVLRKDASDLLVSSTELFVLSLPCDEQLVESHSASEEEHNTT